MLWALYEAPDVPARLVSTLVAVAAHASDDGRGAYPSGSAVGLLTRKSQAQAKKDMAELEKRGLLLAGDQHLAAHIRADRRPKVYDVPIPRGSSGRAPFDSRGSSGTATGLIQAQNGARPDEPEEFLKNSRTARVPARAGGTRQRRRPQWCGRCNERTRMTGDEDHPTRCPRCNPNALAAPRKAQPAWTP